MGAYGWIEHVGVASFSYFFINFSHFPFEVFIEIRDIFGDEASEYVGNLFELFFVLFGVEFKGTTEDSTVI